MQMLLKGRKDNAQKTLKFYGIIGLNNVGIDIRVEPDVVNQLDIGTLLAIGKSFYESRGMFENNEHCMINLCFVNQPETSGINRRISLPDMEFGVQTCFSFPIY